MITDPYVYMYSGVHEGKPNSSYPPVPGTVFLFLNLAFLVVGSAHLN